MELQALKRLARSRKNWNPRTVDKLYDLYQLKNSFGGSLPSTPRANQTPIGIIPGFWYKFPDSESYIKITNYLVEQPNSIEILQSINGVRQESTVTAEELDQIMQPVDPHIFLFDLPP